MRYDIHEFIDSTNQLIIVDQSLIGLREIIKGMTRKNIFLLKNKGYTFNEAYYIIYKSVNLKSLRKLELIIKKQLREHKIQKFIRDSSIDLEYEIFTISKNLWDLSPLVYLSANSGKLSQAPK